MKKHLNKFAYYKKVMYIYKEFKILIMSNLQRKRNACFGIEMFLMKNNLKTSISFVSKITSEFLKEKGLHYKEYNPRYKGLFNAAICNAELVQQNFSEFKLFIKKNYIN